jgi:hypothetical protein
MTIKPLKVSPKMIEATKALLTATAYVDTVRPVVERLKAEVLAALNYKTMNMGRYLSNPKYNVTQFNKDWMIRYYPDSSDKYTHGLIGFHKFRAIVGNDTVFLGLLERLEDSPNNIEELKLRRGVKFVAYTRGFSKNQDKDTEAE